MFYGASLVDLSRRASTYVASLARPGGNITGLSTLAPEISGKRLEILREVVPNLSRIAVLGHFEQPGLRACDQRD
jgi:ABC-type uncharacterized transport system substrate-binding protein